MGMMCRGKCALMCDVSCIVVTGAHHIPTIHHLSRYREAGPQKTIVGHEQTLILQIS